jgi:hypothetical protein
LKAPPLAPQAAPPDFVTRTSRMLRKSIGALVEAARSSHPKSDAVTDLPDRNGRVYPTKSLGGPQDIRSRSETLDQQGETSFALQSLDPKKRVAKQPAFAGGFGGETSFALQSPSSNQYPENEFSRSHPNRVFAPAMDLYPTK